jgi:hypothetical protein
MSLHVKDMLQQSHQDGQDEEFARRVLRLPGHVGPVVNGHGTWKYFYVK